MGNIVASDFGIKIEKPRFGEPNTPFLHPAPKLFKSVRVQLTPLESRGSG